MLAHGGWVQEGLPEELARLQREEAEVLGAIGPAPQERFVPRTVAEFQAAIAREHITWRSFWDGGDTSGPIATQYGVRGWPTIYVLDHEGIIRYKNVRGPAMDKAVDELLDKVSTSNIIHANSETFAAHLESKKPLMLDFYAEW